MAKKKESKKVAEQLSAVMVEHIEALGLANIKEYKNWCRQHKFSKNLGKNSQQRYKELEIVKKKERNNRLCSLKKESNLRKAIDKIFRQEINAENVHNALLKEIYQILKKSKIKAEIHNFLLHLESNSKLLKDITFIKGIIALTRFFSQWKQPFNQWKPKTYNPGKQFSSLARYLLTDYPVPIFMDKAWLTGNEAEQHWFIHIGAGENIRKAKNLPITLTKKMAHYFLTAPDNYSIDAAFRWAQVHALDGNKRIADALLDTRIINNFTQDHFWSGVIRFFIDNPMLDTMHYNPIIDYIWQQKFQPQVAFMAWGVAEERGPLQPNFSIRGRTPESLLKQVDRWHQQLGKTTRKQALQWKHSKFKDFEFKEGSNRGKNLRFWRIYELLSAKKLIHEGRIMHHCVASYIQSCHSGRCSIWSLELLDAEGSHKELTIEVSNLKKMIIQARGKRNRLPVAKDKEIISRWASQQGLSLAPYI